MLDKLSLITPQKITLEDATNNLKGRFSHHKATGTKYHHSVISFHNGLGKDGKHLLTLHLQPRFSSIANTKIEVNPSNFQSFGELAALLSSIVDTSGLKLSRIDHAVDIEVTVAEIFSALIYSRKKSREVFRDSTLTGFYLGSPPEQLVVYNKARQLTVEGTKTRIELRHYGEKISSKSFIDLPDCQSMNPFNDLKFRRVTADPYTSIRDRNRKNYISELIQTKGAQGMFKILNKHSNFKRDWESDFEEHSDIPNLNQIYQENLKRYFKEE